MRRVSPGRAETDPLTGLANRTVFRDRLVHALSRLPRTQGRIAVMSLDLDRFKAINDSMGHRVGDQLVTATAQRLLAFLRPSDTVARMEADEFAILLEDLPSGTGASVTGLALRIAHAGRLPFTVGGKEVVCTIRNGVAETDDADPSPDQLVNQAGLAMYKVKNDGRQGFEVYTVVAVEALARIRSGTDPLLLPAAFLDVAIETGLVRQIDACVLCGAAAQAATWRHRGARPPSAGWSQDRDLAVHVNLTGRHVSDPAFADMMIGLLQENDLDAGGLALELREEDLARLSDAAVESLCTVIGLCHHHHHHHDLTVLALGVETPAQLEILGDLGCDQVQGFLLAGDAEADGLVGGDLKGVPEARVRAKEGEYPAPCVALVPPAPAERTTG